MRSGRRRPVIEDTPALPSRDPELIASTEDSALETSHGRLAKRKSKLLYRTPRNRLLNFKLAKSNIRGNFS